MEKRIKIEQVENGFVVYTDYSDFHQQMIMASHKQRFVFNTQKQLNKFLSEYFKKENV
jgi:hypothetical protein